MKLTTSVGLIVCCFVFCEIAFPGDTLQQKYIHEALQGSLKSIAPEVLNAGDTLTGKDSALVVNFAGRFGPEGRIEKPDTDIPFIKDVVTAYREYWTDVFFNDYDSDKLEQLITDRLAKILNKYGIQVQDSVGVLQTVSTEFDKLGYTALTGRTPPHFDLLAWKGNEAENYTVQLTDGPIDVKVYFMGDFVSFGWSHYATFGAAYPGGWATDEALYCMADDYDTTSEKFKVSYLQHEGRHFADYKIFPKLKSTDLEFRAKLTELIYADSTLYNLINIFNAHAARNAHSPHALASYELIGLLSQNIFSEDFVNDSVRWLHISPSEIHATAKELLDKNTEDLIAAGADTVQGIIKP